MTDRMQLNVEHAVLHDPCPRCGSLTVRAIVYGPLDFAVEAESVDAQTPDFADFTDEAPIFDCRECGFEWGLAVRDLLA
ncbi:hypothetical protein GE115_06055 [Agromyces sp. CFH 90414]|uniref:Uncharacterized protein n=1 Tax=Agromyces agglutinans TaxID=2662258 RepID=A0A6I2F6Q2_9MICO|nr:hypothetical protein [Agromyces agglutinans]MRG59437.1 hypothetical protein [Agromyces agglutinans]